ncbi:class I SAM-dependent methyltransferase [Candidatus Lokiarchaeum ossiferum]|uniref:class I SAM-dependent methyltransferase n=1 Tax=Candidatus Lokiarchaeum ossiferum TaxID=2951803 RepID=UPI00352BED53
MENIQFTKYKTRGAYHWNQISHNLIERNSFVLARYINIISLIKNNYGDISNKKILDVGCGDGVLSYFLYKENAFVSGIDSSELSINFAKLKTKNCNINFYHGSSNDLPFINEEFDIVVSSDVIEHVFDYNKFLSEIHRVVKKQGLVVISTPIRITEAPLDKMHFIEWFQNEYKELITKHFPKSIFFESHPLFWSEFYLRSTLFRLILNVISIFKNPFQGFTSKFRIKTMQYSISTKK